jgi:hypothetical protein
MHPKNLIHTDFKVLNLSAACLITLGFGLLWSCQAPQLPEPAPQTVLPSPEAAARSAPVAAPSPLQPIVETRPILLTETPIPTATPSSAVTGSASPAAGPSAPVPTATPTPPTQHFSTAIALKAPRELSYLYRAKADRTSEQQILGADQTILETRTPFRIRFEPQANRQLLVDLWIESSQQVYYDIFDGQQRNERPVPTQAETNDETSDDGGMSTSAAEPSLHLQALYQLNGTLVSIKQANGQAASLQGALNQFLAPFFSTYSPSTVRNGDAWPAKAFLFGNLEKLLPDSRIQNKGAPSWLMKDSDTDLLLDYRGEVTLIRQGTAVTLKEQGNASYESGSGLLKHLNVSLNFKLSTGTKIAPLQLEIQRL